MNNSIEWNYIQAKRQADKLEEQAEQIRRTAAGRMEEAIQTLSSSWEGRNAGICLGKAVSLKGAVEDSSKTLLQTAEVIRILAERTYQAEMRILEIARVRRY